MFNFWKKKSETPHAKSFELNPKFEELRKQIETIQRAGNSIYSEQDIYKNPTFLDFKKQSKAERKELVSNMLEHLLEVYLLRAKVRPSERWYNNKKYENYAHRILMASMAGLLKSKLSYTE
ncbi:MAG: hypothetical protein AAFV80_22465, partial [Bacteroidota bacterium]